MTEDRINRQTRIVRADLRFDGIAWGAKGARSNLSFHSGAEGPHIHCPAPPVAPWKPIKEKAPELLMGS